MKTTKVIHMIEIDTRTRWLPTKEERFAEITVNVLGFFDETESAWTAMALEMDLRAWGNTFEEVLKELVNLICTQISFALFKKQPDMILKPADPKWTELYTQVENIATLT